MNLARTLLWVLFALLMAAPVKAAAPFPQVPVPTPIGSNEAVAAFETALSAPISNLVVAVFGIMVVAFIVFLIVLARFGAPMFAFINNLSQENKGIRTEMQTQKAEMQADNDRLSNELIRAVNALVKLAEKTDEKLDVIQESSEESNSKLDTVTNVANEIKAEIGKVLDLISQLMNSWSSSNLGNLATVIASMQVTVEQLEQLTSAVIVRAKEEKKRQSDSQPIPPLKEIVNGQTTPEQSN